MKLEDEFKQPYDTWKLDPSPAATGVMLKTLEPVVQTALRSYGGNKPSPTMHTRAQVLAADALKSYDPAKGKLKTHMLQNLQRLQRYAAREQSAVRVPEAASAQRRSLQAAKDTFTQEHGYTPSYTDLANRTGLSTKRIAAVLSAPSLAAEGTLDKRDSENAWYSPSVVPRADQLPPWIDMAYDDLSPLDQNILEGIMGLHGAPKQSVTQLSRNIGISPAAISKRVERIQQMLDTWEDMK